MNAGKQVIEDFQAGLLSGLEHDSFGNVTKLLSKLDAVQEQPQLLDPYLQALIDPIVSRLTDGLRPIPLTPHLRDLFHILYYLSKVRGAKVIVKFLPNDVYLMDPVIGCLEAQDKSDVSIWQARYILLLWLSLICMAPFDMRTFDQSCVNSSVGRVEIVDTILSTAESFLGASSKERESAGLLIARLLTRKDVNREYLPDFFRRTLGIWRSATCTVNDRTGLLTSLCEIFQIGNRDILITHADGALEMIKDFDESRAFLDNTLLRKLRVKLAQRVALTMLKPNRASWRYRNDPKSLDFNVQSMEDDCAEDPSDVIEEMVGLMIETLRDKDTIVRYSAAKGLGRITSRLPLSFAEEIISAIQGLFEDDTHISRTELCLNDDAKESTWHGCCLAVAELCRNGALMPISLKSLMPFIFLAIQFDIRRGSHSVGTAVRDAACYVTWSILRCYKTDILSPYLEIIATKLIGVAMFDREISVRRAASAAYQEGVGRHSNTIPDGIAILALADFHAVGQRKTSFLEVGPAVFSYPLYRKPILSYLVQVSSAHWDRELRELAGQTMGCILKSSAASILAVHDLFVDQILYLSANTQSIDINARHGAFFALGQLCGAVTTILCGETCLSARRTLLRISDSLLRVPFAVPSYMLKGPTAGLMYSGVCQFISRSVVLQAECLRLAQIDDSNADFPTAMLALSEQFLAISTGGFTVTDDQVRDDAAEALRSLFEFSPLSNTIGDHILDFDRLPSTGPVRKGWLAFFGRPVFKDVDILRFVLKKLTAAATVLGVPTRDDPETRRLALKSLQNVITQLVDPQYLTEEDIGSVIHCLSQGLIDYTVDARGDVGNWVREASVKCAAELFKQRHVCQGFWLQNADVFSSLLTLALTQCLGKIDNSRVVATQIMTKTIHQVLENPSDLYGSTLDLLQSILPILDSTCQHLYEGDSSITVFRDFAPLLNSPMLRQSVLKEYLISGSAGSQSVMTAATSAITHYLDQQDSPFLAQILGDIIEIVLAAKDDDRVLIPVLSSTAALFDNQIFEYADFEFTMMFNTIQKSTMNSNAIPKIAAALRCYAALTCSLRDVRHKAWRKLSLTLTHRYPRVRVLAAELMYSVLSNLNIESETEASAVVSALTEVDWSMTIDKEQVEKVKAYLLP